MPAITSSTILAGPCKLVYDGATIYSKGNVTIKLTEERWMVKVSGMPGLQERTSNRRYEISFEPAGQWASLSVLYPYGSTVIGSQIFSNETLTIWDQAATYNKRVFSNAAITKCPGIKAGVKDTVLGDMTFTAILKDGVIPGASDAYVVISTDTYPTEAFDLSTVITPVYTHVWGGSSPWSSFNVGDAGVVFDFPISIRDQNVSGLGTVNMVLTGRGGSAKFTPVGVTEAEVITATGANTVMGAAPTVNNLVVAGTGIHLTLYNAQMKDVNLNFDSETDRIGEMTAMATQTLSAGALNPLYRIGTAAP